MLSPCGEGLGGNLPLAVLLAAAEQIGWLGRDSLAAILATMQGKAKAKATTPEAELAQKETEGARKLRKRGWQASVRSGFRPREDAQQCLEDLRAMRAAVRGTGAAASDDGQRPTPMEQDTDRFKHKIEQLNLSAKRARTDSNADDAASSYACTVWSLRPA